MATRSAIGIEKDGKVFAAYCHWDGYPENNGRILQEHYRNPEKTLKLISLGDMSSLAEEFEPAPGIEHSFQKPAKGVTVYYGRDRNEEGVEFRVFEDRDKMVKFYDDCDYFYVWSNNHWIYRGRRGGWAELKEALDQIDAEAAQ